jgi:hypothetical protein
MNRGPAVIGLARGKRVEFDAVGRFHREPLDARDRIRCLVDEFGIGEEIACRVPRDRPTPPPPGSRKAARLAGLEVHAAA